MISKLTRDIIQSEIADFFAGVVEIHTELGGPNTVEEAQNQLTDRVLACVPEVDSEPVYQVYGDVDDTWSDVDEEEMIRCRSIGEDTRTLYSAPQSPVVDSEPKRNPVLAYADSYRDMAKQGVESVPIWSVITDLERNIAPLCRHAQPATEREPVKRFNADQMHRICLEANRHMDKFGAMAKEVNKLLGRIPAQPAPVAMDDRKLRALFDSWFASDCSFDLSPEASEADNIAWRESYWYVWQRCRTAMLQAANSPVIGIDLAAGPDRSVEVRYVAPPGYVMVPAKLTAENGAKSALLGEFNLEYTLTCHECFGEGCEDCNDEGRWINSIPVDWTTIKEIWAKGVEHFAAAPQEVKGDS